MPVLLGWLRATGRIRRNTQVAFEVPWLGRRVDLALLNSRGVTTAFELKIGGLQRVLEQAAYNRSGFYRSWIVTGNHPKEDGVRWAERLNLGLIVVQNCSIRLLLNATYEMPPAEATSRLRVAIVTRAKAGR